MSKNSIMVHLGDEAPISDNLRSAIEGLIQAVESSGLEPDDDVAGFVKPDVRSVMVGAARPMQIAKGPTTDAAWGCLGYEANDDGSESCWIMW